jgi:glucans biosynthesis protein C
MSALPETKTEIKESTERVFALDALRGIMMLLGIVLHAASTYANKSSWSVWRVKDPNNNLFFKTIVEFIHSFRMPVFFVVAGFFCALLYYKKSPFDMIKNRFNRIVLPFLAGVLVIWPLTLMAIVFSNSAFDGLGVPFMESLKKASFLPFNMAHLWFLYFLAILAGLLWILATVFKKKNSFTILFIKCTSYVLNNFWLRLTIFSIFYIVCLFIMGTEGIVTSTTWLPKPIVLLFYFVLFATGWMIYKTRSLDNISSYSISQLIVAITLFLVSAFSPWPNEEWSHTLKQIFTAIYGPLFIFGFLGFFVTYFNSYSQRLGYLMEASYWVYIVHLPIVIFIPGLMAETGLSVLTKFAVTLLATSIICLISYKYFVRSTFIGLFLSGKVYKN